MATLKELKEKAAEDRAANSRVRLAQDFADPTAPLSLKQRLKGWGYSTVEQATVGAAGLPGRLVQNWRQGVSSRQQLSDIAWGLMSNQFGKMGTLGLALQASIIKVPEVERPSLQATNVSEDITRAIQEIDVKLVTNVNDLRNEINTGFRTINSNLEKHNTRIGKVETGLQSMEVRQRQLDAFMKREKLEDIVGKAANWNFPDTPGGPGNDNTGLAKMPRQSILNMTAGKLKMRAATALDTAVAKKLKLPDAKETLATSTIGALIKKIAPWIFGGAAVGGGIVAGIHGLISSAKADENHSSNQKVDINTIDYFLRAKNSITLESEQMLTLKAQKIKIEAGQSIEFSAPVIKGLPFAGPGVGGRTDEERDVEPQKSWFDRQMDAAKELWSGNTGRNRTVAPGAGVSGGTGAGAGQAKPYTPEQLFKENAPEQNYGDKSSADSMFKSGREQPSSDVYKPGSLDSKGVFPGTASAENSSLDHINPNQLKFLRAMAATESGWNKDEVYSEKYNQPHNNANVRKMGEAGKDYGYFQNNAQQVKEAVEKYGMDPELAKHLNGGGSGGTSTPEQQTAAMHDYLSRRWPALYEGVKNGDPASIEAARAAMAGTWFGLRDSWNKGDAQAALAGKVSPGMVSKQVAGSDRPYINLNYMSNDQYKGIVDSELKKGTSLFHIASDNDNSSEIAKYIQNKGGKTIAYWQGGGDAAYGETEIDLSSKEGQDAIREKAKAFAAAGHSGMQIDNLQRLSNSADMKKVFDAVHEGSGGKLKIVPNGNPEILDQFLKENPEYKDRIQYSLFENASKFDEKNKNAMTNINKMVPGYNIEYSGGKQAATLAEARKTLDGTGLAGVYHYSHGEGEDGKTGGVSGNKDLTYMGARSSPAKVVSMGGTNVGYGATVTNARVPDAAMPFRVNQLQGDVAAVRKGSLQDNLVKQLEYAGSKTGLGVDVVSGGQRMTGAPGAVGSTRHDQGGAADLKLYTIENGKKRYLDMTNPEDQQRMSEFVKHAVAAGATGVGAGLNYMGKETIHIGGGHATTWGGAEWVKDAWKAGRETKVDINLKPELPAIVPNLPMKERALTAIGRSSVLENKQANPNALMNAAVAGEQIQQARMMERAQMDPGAIKPAPVEAPGIAVSPPDEAAAKAQAATMAAASAAGTDDSKGASTKVEEPKHDPEKKGNSVGNDAKGVELQDVDRDGV